MGLRVRAALPSAPAASSLIASDNSRIPSAPPTRTEAFRNWLAQFNLWHLLLLLLLILLVVALIVRWFSRIHPRVPRLAGYFAVSLLLHLLLALLVTDLLIQTRAVTLEQISPALAVTVQALEEATGIALTPPGPAVPWRDKAAPAQVARPAPRQSQEELPPASPALPAMEAQPLERALAAATATAAPSEELERIKARQERREARLEHPKDPVAPPKPHTAIAEKPPDEARELALDASAARVEEAASLPATATREISPAQPAPVPAAAHPVKKEILVARLVDMREPLERTLPATPAKAADTPAMPTPRTAAKDEAERTAPTPLQQRPAAATAAAAATAVTTVRPAGDAASALALAPAAASAPASAPQVVAAQIAHEPAAAHLPAAPETLPPTEIADTPPMPAPHAVAADGEKRSFSPAAFAQAPATAAPTANATVTAARPGGIISARETAPALIGAAAQVDPPMAAATPRRLLPSGAAALPTAPAKAYDEPAAAIIPRPTTGQAEGSGRQTGPTIVAQAPAAAASSASVAGALAARPEIGVAPRAPAAAPLHAPATATAKASAVQPLAENRLVFRIGAGGEASRRVTIGLARYGGDWDWARLAMTFLGHQIRERTRLALNAEDRVVSFDSPDLRQLPFVYMTGHRDFRFTEAEVANLRSYLLGGGYLWADDSTHYRDETFDAAFRRELARVLPRARLERLDMTFPGFRTGYDLTRGYKGYAVPPGDKYRLDYIEGARVDGRVAVVYTRNDYGDGLNIDAHTHPLQVSLTDLSPAEMQEGAVRMGVNLTLYFLTHGRGDVAFLDDISKLLRQQAEAAAPGAPPGVARPLPGFEPGSAWTSDTWSDPSAVAAAPEWLTWDFTVAEQGKSAISLPLAAPLAWTVRDVVVIEVQSGLRSGARLALGATIGGRYFESRPAYLKPGANVALFPCGERTFKSAEGGWEYRDGLPLPGAVERLTLLVYSPAAGSLRLANARTVLAE